MTPHRGGAGRTGGTGPRATRLAACSSRPAPSRTPLPHVQRFVGGNLAGGLDHLVVFLDQPGAPGQDDVAAFLEGHDHVTCVRAGPRMVGRAPPGGPQRAPVHQRHGRKPPARGGPGAASRRRRLGLPRRRRRGGPARPSGPGRGAGRGTRRAARTRARPSAGCTWDGEPTLFKRPLDEPELRLLHLLGVHRRADQPRLLPRPPPGQGRRAARPRHVARAAPGARATDGAAGRDARRRAPRALPLRVLLGRGVRAEVERDGRPPGRAASFRAGRAAVARRGAHAAGEGPRPRGAPGALLRIYARTTEDDADDPARARPACSRPTRWRASTDPPAAPDDGQALAEGLQALRGADKSAYFRGSAARTDGSGRPGGEAGSGVRGRGLLGRST